MAKRGRPSLTHGWSACASKYLKPGTRPLLRYRSGEFTPSSRLSPCGGQPLSRAIFRPELEASDRSGSRGFHSWVLGEVSKTLSKPPSFVFNSLQPLFPKQPGWEYPNTSAPSFTSVVIYAMRSLHRQSSQQVAPTSCHHHGGVRTTPLPRPKGEGPARCSPCRRLSRPRWPKLSGLSDIPTSSLATRHWPLATAFSVTMGDLRNQSW